MKNTLQSLQTTFKATLSTASLALLGAINLASLPAATISSASFGGSMMAVAAQAAPWLGLGAGLLANGNAMAQAQFQTKPVVGVGVRICKNPGGSTACIANPGLNSGPDGSFQATGLAPGNYDVTPDGGKSMLFKVGADGKLSGIVQEEGGVRSVVKPKAVSTSEAAPGSADKGIKDNGIRGCGKCGLTAGKEATPTPGTSGSATESTHAKHKDEIVAPGANARSGGSTTKDTPGGEPKSKE